MNTIEKRQRNNKPIHGGDISEAIEEFGAKENGWIDLSTGINRDYYPKIDVGINSVTNLPTKQRLKDLIASARNYYEVQAHNTIIAAPGTQSILQHLPAIFPEHKVAILSPTYSEHHYTWDNAGNTVTLVNSLTKLKKGSIGVVVNPNNPDGKQQHIEDLINLAKKLELLIIDEAFCDGVSNLSVIPYLENNNIIVLRSLGKFFGLAGLRLGFAIGKKDLTQALEKRLGPWAVSGAAIEIGNRALSDQTWIQLTVSNLQKKSSRLNVMLETKFERIGGTNLFTLVKARQAPEVYKTLGHHGIFIRQFKDHKDWLRIGLPGPEFEWRRLEEALNPFSNTIDNVNK